MFKHSAGWSADFSRRVSVVGLGVFAFAWLSACERSPSAQEPRSDPATSQAAATPAALKTVRIPVEGMSCVACAARVKSTLVALEGVDEVEVHLGERNARVRFDSNKLAADRLVAAINDLGYSAGSPVPADR